MITEDRMRALLDSAAADVEVPPGGPARVLAVGGNTEPVEARRRRLPWSLVSARRLAVTGTAAVVILAGGLAMTDGGGRDEVSTAGAGGPESGTTRRLDAAPADTRPGSDAGGGTVTQYTTGARQPSATDSGMGGSAATTQSATAGDLSKVVRTGSLTIEVATRRFDGVIQAVTTLATGAGGVVSDSRTSSDQEHRSASVTVRMPADRFDTVVADLRRLGPVTHSETAADDVTAEYADVEARSKALDTTRTALLTVLSEAKAVGDILAVRDRLNAVQTEIEQLRGRQRVLDDRVSLATVSVQLVEPGAARAVATEPGRSSWHKAVDGFTGTWAAVLAKSGSALATVLLVAALLALGVLIARSARRTFARLVA